MGRESSKEDKPPVPPNETTPSSSSSTSSSVFPGDPIEDELSEETWSDPGMESLPPPTPPFSSLKKKREVELIFSWGGRSLTYDVLVDGAATSMPNVEPTITFINRRYEKAERRKKENSQLQLQLLQPRCLGVGPLYCHESEAKTKKNAQEEVLRS